MDKEKEARDSINEGGKIILPPDVLDELSRMSVEYPLTFSLTNHARQKTTHCGVLEFVAPHSTAFLPYWMMKNLMLNEGDEITISYAQLPQCTYAKLRPSTADFLDLTNPRIVLEKSLRKYACLTSGDTIAVTFGTHVYELGVVEVKPGPAVSIIECDFQLDFDVPEGFLPPPKPVAPKAAPVPVPAALPLPPAPEEPSSFHGQGYSLRKKKSEPTTPAAAAAAAMPTVASAPAPAADGLPRGALPFVYGVLNFPRPAIAVSAPAAATAGAAADPFRGQGHSLKSK